MAKRPQTRRKIATQTETSKAVKKDGAVISMNMHSMGWMNHNFSAEPAVNANELTSLNALIAYVAYITKKNEFSVERQFSDRFNIPNVKCLPSERYDAAIRYLVDQVPAQATVFH